jgi:AmiR/NasT family two-component response regulator
MAINPLSQLSRLRLLVVCEPDEEGHNLLRHLQRTRAAVRHQWPAPDRIGEDADVLLCDYGPGLGKRLAWMPGEAEAALIVLLPQNGRFDFNELHIACPNAVLHRPYLPHAIDAALLVAHDQFAFFKRQKSRIARMEENSRAMRDIEKAKQMIMLRDRVSEAEAFRMLRDIAMKKRATIASIASKLVDTSDSLV